MCSTAEPSAKTFACWWSPEARRSSDRQKKKVSTRSSEPLELNGAFTGVLTATINKADMDVGVVLYELTAGGEYFCLSHFLGRASYARDMAVRRLLEPGVAESIPIRRTIMTSRRLNEGSRLIAVLNINKNASYLNLGHTPYRVKIKRSHDMHVNYAIVLVGDMQRSITFYRDVIGLPMRFETLHWTEFATEGATLALHLSSEPGDPNDVAGHERAGNCRPGLGVPNLDEFHRRVVAEGVMCLQEPRDVFGSRVATYLDPDGLPISVGENRNGSRPV